jgi:hypothetical protein
MAIESLPKILCSSGIINIYDIIAISEIKKMDIKKKLLTGLMFLFLNLKLKKLNPMNNEHRAVSGDILPWLIVVKVLSRNK